ncbi:MAG: phosphoribosylformylglycinamidine synthase subunit PurQ [Spirochaetales bacterium]|jgi:phosphoribosylformylglycinamidine synthase subunit PurQ / glutaminase|nr:phosphoribosylformylglycinamidine synthase subunit PurQ [Spirochaetales bacterium]
MKKVKTCIITGYGINADRELASAFKAAGSDAERVHINDLINNPVYLRSFQIVGFPGGFSFGDHLGSGLVFAGLFKRNLKSELSRFVTDGGLIIGVCNGFQVLVKMGVLPNLSGDWTPDVSLIHNQSGVFEDSWVKVACPHESRCVWTKGLSALDLPIRHGEGRFITGSPEIAQRLADDRLIAMTYETRNPNGSEDNIAGICDSTGRIIGLMPHPEAYLHRENHPEWRSGIQGDGLGIFRNGVLAASST